MYILPNSELIKLPEGVDLEVAVLTEPLACSVALLDRYRSSHEWVVGDAFGVNRSVVVFGAGAIGLLAVALVLSLRYAVGAAFMTPEEDRMVVAAAEAVQKLAAEDEPVVTMHGSAIDLLYYCDRPGWAVVSTEEVEIHPSADLTPSIEGRIWDERDLPAHQMVTDAIHAGGALAAIQLVHSGMAAPNWGLLAGELGLDRLSA